MSKNADFEILKYENKSHLPGVIIVDIDGTIAERGDRSPYDMNKVSLDRPKNDVLRIVRSLAAGYPIIYFTGRDESCREETEKWIAKYCRFRNS